MIPNVKPIMRRVFAMQEVRSMKSCTLGRRVGMRTLFLGLCWSASLRVPGLEDGQDQSNVLQDHSNVLDQITDEHVDLFAKALRVRARWLRTGRGRIEEPPVRRPTPSRRVAA